MNDKKDTKAAKKLMDVKIVDVFVTDTSVTMLGDDDHVYSFRIDSGYDGAGDENPRHPYLKVVRSKVQKVPVPRPPRLRVQPLREQARVKAQTKAEREFEVGFNDAFNGKDCLRVAKNYVAGYMKGREVAISTGRPLYKSPLGAE